MTRELSPQQRRVHELIARGMANKHIAEELGTGISSIRNQVHEVLLKLGCANRTEAALLWVQSNGHAKIVVGELSARRAK